MKKLIVFAAIAALYCGCTSPAMTLVEEQQALIIELTADNIRLVNDNNRLMNDNIRCAQARVDDQREINAFLDSLINK